MCEHNAHNPTDVVIEQCTHPRAHTRRSEHIRGQLPRFQALGVPIEADAKRVDVRAQLTPIHLHLFLDYSFHLVTMCVSQAENTQLLLFTIKVRTGRWYFVHPVDESKSTTFHVNS
jgi:hypothetical protein